MCDLLTERGYSLQSTRKTHEGGKPPDRDAQFQHIAHQVASYQTVGDPVILVDTINAQSAVELLKQIEQQHPSANRIHIICDNARYYRSLAGGQ